MVPPVHLTVRPLGRLPMESLLQKVYTGRTPFALDSSLTESELGRYSFLGSDPVGWFRSRGRLAAYSCPWGEETRAGDPLKALADFLGLLPWGSVGRPPKPIVGGRVG